MAGAVSKDSAEWTGFCRMDSMRAVDEIVDTVIVDGIGFVWFDMIAEGVTSIVREHAPAGAAERDEYFTEAIQRLAIVLASLYVVKVAPDGGPA